MKTLKDRMESAACVLGGFLVLAGVIILFGSIWGLAVVVLGGLLMAPAWLPALDEWLEYGNSPYLTAFWKWAKKPKGPRYG